MISPASAPQPYQPVSQQPVVATAPRQPYAPQQPFAPQQPYTQPAVQMPAVAAAQQPYTQPAVQMHVVAVAQPVPAPTQQAYAQQAPQQPAAEVFHVQLPPGVSPGQQLQLQHPKTGQT